MRKKPKFDPTKMKELYGDKSGIGSDFLAPVLPSESDPKNLYAKEATKPSKK